jgi:hypothetical protein
MKSFHIYHLAVLPAASAAVLRRMKSMVSAPFWTAQSELQASVEVKRDRRRFPDRVLSLEWRGDCSMSELQAVDDMIDEDNFDDALSVFPNIEARSPHQSPRRSSFRLQHLRAMRLRRQERWRRTATVEWTIRIVVLVCGLFIGAALARPSTRATATTPGQPLTTRSSAAPDRPAAASAVADSAAAEPAIVANVQVLDGGERGTSGEVVTPAVDTNVTRPEDSPRLQGPAGHRGTLIVTSTPDGASVFMNQNYAGRTPLRMQDVTVGSRALRIDLDGYGSWSRGVNVVADESTTVSATLSPATVP